MVWKATGWRGTLVSAALGGALLLGVSFVPSGTAQARDRDDQCFERLRREESKLDRDANRHGFFSRQAQNDRRRIQQLRGQCRFEGRRFRRGDGDFDRDDRGRHRRGDGDGDRDDRGRHRGWDRDRDRDDRGRHHRDWDRDRDHR